MGNEIIKYLSKYTSLSNELAEIVLASTIIKNFKKGTILLKEGDISKESYFVLKGCVRSYLIDNGEDKTLDFHTEEQPILPISYGKETLSEQYLECIEDSILTVNTPEHENEMFLKYPQFESVCRIMTEVMMSNFQESFVNFKTTSPEERYLFILKNRPDLLQRVPLFQLASYLGLKPESLSRLRKRLVKNKRL
ncbi:MAG: Crp/Fnr family transcriptional regulator [Bacteroidales bacterium]|nr:Crp/Fnr family transcriptional regulator [Bacteroidales bacterium]